MPTYSIFATFPAKYLGKHREAGKAGGAQDTLVDFLTSRQGKALQREVVRGVFGLLRKRL